MKLGTSSIPLLFFLALSADAARADSFAFTQINVPGAYRTTATGINNSGQIVGTFTDGNGTHIFVDTLGTFTSFDLPGDLSQYSPSANSINNSGRIVGTLTEYLGPVPGPGNDSFQIQHGFILQNGAFTLLDFPGSTATLATGINDEGDIVGLFSRSTGGHLTFQFQPFLYKNGVFESIAQPEGVYSPSFLIGINNLDQIVGGTSLYTDGVFISFPARPGRQFYPFAINDPGQIVGTMQDRGGNQYAELYSQGMYTDVTALTSATAVNNAGQIIANDRSRSFVLTPVPEPNTMTLLGAGFGAGLLALLIRRRKVRASSPSD